MAANGCESVDGKVGGVRRLPGALVMGVCLLLGACGETAWNNPYPAADAGRNILYSSFDERPKHLDPAQSYSSNEVVFTGQIYEPPLQYHYLKRPYVLEPLTAEAMPEPRFLDAQGRDLPASAPADTIVFSVYDIRIRPGIRYQPHPAFARNAQGQPLYLDLSRAEIDKVHTLADFPETGTRELTAADYIYQIKRLAHPRIHSPILGLMSEHIVGLQAYAERLREVDKGLVPVDGVKPYLDLDAYDLEGAQALDRYTYRIKVHGKYPQLLYWLAMPFFAPIPPEAERFYSQAGMAEKNINLDWYPIGTGPYMLTENNPNLRMVLEVNPNYHGDTYPDEGEPEDLAAGHLRDAGKPLPFVERVVYSLEQETIPYWNKFLQGYYDVSGISSDSFDQAIRFSGQGEVMLSDAMAAKGIQLNTVVAPSISYMGFNMLDPVVGGDSERARKLRQAISIAIDQEEYISIFLNGRGQAAQGPLPPGIFGHVDGEGGINPYVYDWVNGKPRRKSIEYARRLLAEAGYADGIDAAAGQPLLLYLDTVASGADDKSRLDWLRKQFAKLKLQLVVRDTDYNRFQDKMIKGTAQLFQWGWNADYPDPENFLFLLNGPNAKVGKGGENAANYDSPEFNRLFERMKAMDNGPERQAIIDEMVDIARRDAPWIYGFFPQQFSLYHAWYSNAKPNLMSNNLLKYRRVDPELRARKQAEWNRPVLWPLGVVLLLLVLGTLPAVVTWWRREHAVRTRIDANAKDAKAQRAQS